MKKILLSAGLATAVIFGVQAQETTSSESTQQAIEKQEQAIETLKEAVKQQEAALEALKQASDQQTQAMNTEQPDSESPETQSQGDLYEDPNQVEETSYEVEEEAQETQQEVEQAVEETEQTFESGAEEVEQSAEETGQAIESGVEEAGQEAEAKKDEAQKEVNEHTQADAQSSQNQASQSQPEFASEDMKKITEAELPQEVKDSFESSDYKDGSIKQAFELSGAAVPQVLESRANLSQYAGEQVPEKLYQLQVEVEDGSAILYIGDDGEVIATEEI